jgi:hypothetical protein
MRVQSSIVVMSKLLCHNKQFRVIINKPPTGKLRDYNGTRQRKPIRQRKLDKLSNKNEDSETIVGDSEMSIEYNLFDKTQKTNL